MDATSREDIMTTLADATDVPDPPSLTLLRTLLDEDHAINRKSLCGLWGIKPSTLGHMLRGDINIGIERWAMLFDDVRDLRILRLLIDEQRFAVYALPEPCDIGSTAGIAQAFLRLESAHARMSTYMERMLGILGDMRVDGDDGELVRDLEKELPELISVLLAACRHVMHLYEKWCEHHARGVAGSIGKAVGR